MPHSRPQPGFSLIELLLVLGVMAILLVAMFVIYPRVRMDHQVDREVKQSQEIFSAIERAYHNRPVSGSSTSLHRVLKASGIEVDSTAIAPRHPWGFIVVRPLAGQLGGTPPCEVDPGAIMIQYIGVPVEFCTKFITRVMAAPSQYCHAHVRTSGSNGVLILWEQGTTGAYGAVPGPDRIAEACHSREELLGTGKVHVYVGMH